MTKEGGGILKPQGEVLRALGVMLLRRYYPQGSEYLALGLGDPYCSLTGLNAFMTKTRPIMRASNGTGIKRQICGTSERRSWRL